MLSIAPAADSSYYSSLAKEGYYSLSVEPEGSWYGVGAAAFGLKGTVAEDTFRRVFNGFHPEHGEAVSLVRNAGKPNRDKGWDLTLSLPKELSQLFALGDDGVRDTVSRLHKEAVEGTLDQVQARASRSRLGAGGAIKEKGVGLFFSLFEHASSREGDMQLHTHAVLMNIGLCKDGKTRALESFDLYRYKMAFGAYYRGRVVEKFSREFGISFEADGKAGVRVVGRNEEYYRQCSKRRTQILKRQEEKGLSGGRALAVAAVDTREKKDTRTTREELVRQWQKEALEQGVSYEGLLAGMQGQARKGEKIVREDVVARVIENLFNKYSSFDQYQLAREVFSETQALGVSVYEVGQIEGLVKERVLGIGEDRGREFFTTQKRQELEREFVGRVNAVKGVTHHIAPAVRMKGVSEGGLSDEQKLAFLHVTDTGALKIVEGVAGAGKTTFMRQAVKAWQEDGYDVVGISLAANAASNLAKETGLEVGESVASFLGGVRKGARVVHGKMIILVDEAAMVGVEDLNALLSLGELGAKNVWIGDRAQLQAISPGGGFSYAADTVGASRLETVYRQYEQWGRDMVVSAASGDVGKVLEVLSERGDISFFRDTEKLHTELIKAWEVGRHENRKENLIITGSREESKCLNQLAQEVLIKEGVVSGDTYLRVEGGKFSLGDRVVITKNNKELNVRNGMFGEITELNEVTGRVSIRLDDGGVREINLKTYPHVALGYAVTTHKAQGRTVERAFVAVDQMMASKESFYVQVSRHRDSVKLFAKSANYYDRAFDDLVRAVNRSTRGNLAIELEKELQQAEQARESRDRYFRELERQDRTVSGGEAANWYYKRVLAPINEEYYRLSDENLAATRASHAPFDVALNEDIRRILTGGKYQELEEKRSLLGGACREARERFVALKEQDGFIKRVVSKEYRERLRLAERQYNEANAVYTGVVEQLREFDRYYANEGKEEFSRVRSELLKPYKDKEQEAERIAQKMWELDRNQHERFYKELSDAVGASFTMRYSEQAGEQVLDLDDAKRVIADYKVCQQGQKNQRGSVRL
jgi:conjugative relaxase-like TrwC/TraI family protein